MEETFSNTPNLTEGIELAELTEQINVFLEQLPVKRRMESERLGFLMCRNGNYICWNERI